ncbi:MAG: hypothetical protein ACRD07_23150 [Acidimicrobiales bacterium]
MLERIRACRDAERVLLDGIEAAGDGERDRLWRQVFAVRRRFGLDGHAS